MKRYDFFNDGFDNFEMKESIDGEYVLFEDTTKKGSCKWYKVGFSYYPDCMERAGNSINWGPSITREFTYCPYCGRRITTAST